LNALDAQFSTVPLIDVKLEPFPRDFQPFLTENLNNLQSWTFNTVDNNIPLEELRIPCKSKEVKKKNQDNSSTRESYGRSSAIAARKRILESSPSKHAHARQLSKLEPETEDGLPSNSKDSKKHDQMLKKCLKSVEQFQTKIVSLEKSVASLRKELTGAKIEIQELKKNLGRKQQSSKQTNKRNAPSLVKVEEAIPAVSAAPNALSQLLMQNAMQMLQQTIPPPQHIVAQPLPINNPFHMFQSTNPTSNSSAPKQKGWLQAPNGEWRYEYL
jgi:hypothetical protein